MLRSLLPTTLLLALAMFPSAVEATQQTVGLKDNRYFIDVPDGEINRFFEWTPDFPRLMGVPRGGGLLLPGFPENVIATMDNSMRFGPNLLEIGVQQTSDGVLILMNDDTLDRTTTGSGLIAGTDWATIQTLNAVDNFGRVTDFAIPSLQETLEWGNDRALFAIDIGSQDFLADVVELVTALDAEDDVVIFAHSVEQMLAVYALNPDIHFILEMTADTREELVAAVDASPIPLASLTALTIDPPADPDYNQALHDQGIVSIVGALFAEIELSWEDAIALYQDLISQGADSVGTNRSDEVGAALGYEPQPVMAPSAAIPSAAIPAAAIPVAANTFSQLITFGDSLVDNGNTFNRAGIPPAPYFDGRYSNGLLWNEYVADDLDIPLTNLGFAGATSGEIGGAVVSEEQTETVPGLLAQVAGYTATGEVDPDALYVLWGGAVDYLFLEVVEPSGPVSNMTAAVNQLRAAGAQHFLLLNLPDLGSLPLAETLELPSEGKDLLNAATAGHNQLLAEAVDNFNDANDISVSLLDVNALFNRIVADEGALLNAVDGCLATPACISDPTVQSTFFFWDETHPTTAVHRLVADAALEAVEPPSELSSADSGRRKEGRRQNQ